ncbi:hypothetical protein BDQ17DRAFT_159435 [Cyathus striatus]|nr:hypothetical protein BDQ17DRAFT_159435 [Cyathus striatus]
MASNQDTTIPDHFEVVKHYAPRGAYRQYRLATSTNFTCSRCKNDKKAKLVATCNSEWNALLCNGCYGELLSKS